MRAVWPFLVLLLPCAVPSSGADHPLGLAVVYPPDGDTGPTELLERTARALNLTTTYTWGNRSVLTSGFERIAGDEAAAMYRVWFTLVGRQSHERENLTLHQRAFAGDDGTLLVLPEDLHSGLEVRGGWLGPQRPGPGRFAPWWDGGEGDMLVGALAPTPGLESNGTGFAERAEDVARRFGIPNATPDEWQVAFAPPSPLERIAILGWHERWQFALDCSECHVALRGWPPAITGANMAAAYFTQDGAMVAFVTSPWLDLTNSTLLPVWNAESAARRALEDRFYQPLNLTLEARWLLWSARPAVHQVWHATLAPHNDTRWTSLRLEQDAQTGALVREPYDKLLDPDLLPRPATHAEPPPLAGAAAPGTRRAMGDTWSLAAAALATCALVIGRRLVA